jgi:hypothetical protein
MNKIGKIILELEKQFSSMQKPLRVALDNPKNDFALNKIEEQFHGMDKDRMSKKDATMMILDGPLIKPEAFYYYLPTLAEIVLKEEGEYFMLKLHIDKIDRAGLTDPQISVLHELSSLLQELDKELDE